MPSLTVYDAACAFVDAMQVPTDQFDMEAAQEALSALTAAVLNEEIDKEPHDASR